VSDKDSLVMAVNPREIPFEYADTEPRRILLAGYTAGAPYLLIDRAIGKATGSGYHFRDHLEKEPKPGAKEGEEPAKVATGVLHQVFCPGNSPEKSCIPARTVGRSKLFHEPFQRCSRGCCLRRGGSPLLVVGSPHYITVRLDPWSDRRNRANKLPPVTIPRT
jgi:hypothetical protein